MASNSNALWPSNFTPHNSGCYGKAFLVGLFKMEKHAKYEK